SAFLKKRLKHHLKRWLKCAHKKPSELYGFFGSNSTPTPLAIAFSKYITHPDSRLLREVLKTSYQYDDLETNESVQELFKKISESKTPTETSEYYLIINADNEVVFEAPSDEATSSYAHRNYS